MSRIHLSRLLLAILLIAASCPCAVAAKTPSPAENLKNALEAVFKEYGDPESTVIFTSTNPVTNLLTNSYEGKSFRCAKGAKSLMNAINLFIEERESGLDFMFVPPGMGSDFSIRLGDKVMPLCSKDQTMYMISFKNPDNPKLIDTYAMTLSEDEGSTLDGLITFYTKERTILPIQNNIGYPSSRPAPGAAEKARKFIIDGHVDPQIADSCYNIYIAEVGESINASDLVACVPVVDKKFHFETELSDIKSGRIRAIFPGNELCSAYIDIYFIPGFTADLTVHNGYYNLKNQREYEDLVKNMLYKRSVKPDNFSVNDIMSNIAGYFDDSPVKYNAHIEYPSGPNFTGNIDYNAANLDSVNPKLAKQARIKESLNMYSSLIALLKKNIDQLSGLPVSNDFIQEETKKLCKQIEKIVEKSRKLIEEYAKSID